MSELQECRIREQAILMMMRNYHKNYVVKRILKRYEKCISGIKLSSDLYMKI